MVLVFFLGRTDNPRVRLSHEHTGYRWLEYEEALEVLTFENAKKVLREANEALSPA